jgi:signal peptidase II
VHRLQVPRGAPPLIGEEQAATARNSSTGPFLLAALVLLLDQLTKAWATSALSDGPVQVIGDLLRFRLTRNPGGAFSIGTGLTPLLAVLAVIMAVVIVRTTRRASDRVVAYALGLVLGGALGNLMDRFLRDPGFLRGEVVDFVKLPYWPTFNLADSAITVGVAVIVLRGWRS